MAGKPSDMTEMPEALTDHGRLLRDGLRCLHLSGAIFLRAEFSSPWAYESPESADIVRMLRSGDRRVILFHIFTEGRCRLALPSTGEEIEVRAGDIVILPFCDRHRVGHPELARPTAMSELMPPPPWAEFPIIRFGGGGAATTMVCGYLISDDLPFNPVLASLPRLMRLRLADGPLAHWVDASVAYALHAASGRGGPDDPLMQRLPELLFMECLGEYARSLSAAEGGWLGALVDPVVGRALACLHRQPDQPWTLKELARRAASSRSVLDQRFRTLLGRAPMAYLTAWRLQLASRQLRTTTATLAEIAGATGYGSEASLSRAFKRQVGMSPGQWRVAG